eukprot:SM000208S06345  [mRNA]  locus=s208:235540:237351:- [translate_table: standard]
MAAGPRTDWSRAEVQAVFDAPLMDLLYHGAQVHRRFHPGLHVQRCTLLSVKTGGCSEDCAYCPQSSRHATDVRAQRMLGPDAVLDAARKAKEAGSTRFCMGAAWRDTVGRNANFAQILGYVKAIRGMGMEVCCTLGMLAAEQAAALRDAGLTAYNHNLDTSREFYPSVITTRSYDERLATLALVREAGISVCSGGIIGMGEAAEDRVGLLHTLATLPQHPESVPINALLAVKGTPLQDQKASPVARLAPPSVTSDLVESRLDLAPPSSSLALGPLLCLLHLKQPVEIWEMVRMVATARLVMPESMVRLSAGRVRFSAAEQALCFMAGANSVFIGERLLTTPNNDEAADDRMFAALGLVPKPPNFAQGSRPMLDPVPAADTDKEYAQPAMAAA